MSDIKVGDLVVIVKPMPCCETARGLTMYYEERWIGGRLYWRGSPNGEWIAADVEKLNRRLQEEMTRAKDAFEEGRQHGYAEASVDFGVAQEQ